MKVNVDYQIAHEAIEKFKKEETLSNKEKECILSILFASIGDLIPTKEELLSQENNINKLDRIEPSSSIWNSVMNEINKFENKYC
jgi:hypothetical protein